MGSGGDPPFSLDRDPDAIHIGDPVVHLALGHPLLAGAQSFADLVGHKGPESQSQETSGAPPEKRIYLVSSRNLKALGWRGSGSGASGPSLPSLNRRSPPATAFGCELSVFTMSYAC